MSLATALVIGITAVGASPSAATVTSRTYPPAAPLVIGTADPLGLTTDYLMLDSITLDTDVVGVVRCVVPDNTANTYFRDKLQYGTTNITPEMAATWLQKNVAPYFAEVSEGRMSMRFQAIGSIELTANDGPDECRLRATAAANAPYTNVIAYDTTKYAEGKASEGVRTCRMAASIECELEANAAKPPSTSKRGAWVGGGSVGTVAKFGIRTAAHELGHTLGWPHSYWRIEAPYQNRIDLMSGEVDCEETTRCIRDAQNTLAINRYTSGWLDPSEVRVIEAGTVTVDLAAPMATGLQMLAVRLGQNSFLTIEARPRAGRDVKLPKEGVAVHRITTGGCSSPEQSTCLVGTKRIQVVGKKRITRSAHVVTVGKTKTFAGVDVAVLKAQGSGYRVTVTAG